VKVKLVQQMSGYRPDGSRWPEVGAVLEVSDAEGAELCRADPHTSSAIAVPVAEEAPAEQATVPEEAERADPAPVKRGPGRPPKTPPAGRVGE